MPRTTAQRLSINDSDFARFSAGRSRSISPLRRPKEHSLGEPRIDPALLNAPSYLRMSELDGNHSPCGWARSSEAVKDDVQVANHGQDEGVVNPDAVGD